MINAVKLHALKKMFSAPLPFANSSVDHSRASLLTSADRHRNLVPFTRNLHLIKMSRAEEEEEEGKGSETDKADSGRRVVRA